MNAKSIDVQEIVIEEVNQLTHVKFIKETSRDSSPIFTLVVDNDANFQIDDKKDPPPSTIITFYWHYQ